MNKARHSYRTDNSTKANFDRIYDQPDPLEYFRVLDGLDYVIPDLAKSVFRATLKAIEAVRGNPVSVLDIGCSYGINGALLRQPLSLDRIARRYRDLQLLGIEGEELAELDTHYYQSWPRDRIQVIGLDVSRPAVTYAKRVGMIDEGIVADLENDDLTAEQTEMLRDVGLIISTGAVGYVGARSFDKILKAIGKPRPWVASFVLRMFDYQSLEMLLNQHGLVSDKLRGVTFVQRRFHSEQELFGVLEQLGARGINPDDKEAAGLLHAEFHLARPEGERQALELEDFASVTAGANRVYGRRFQSLPDQRLRFGK